MKRTGMMKRRVISKEIEEYNRVSMKNSIIPTYDVTKYETFIDLYFNHEGEVMIVGNIEGTDYIFWLSITKTDDVEMNEKIFHHIAYGEMERISQLYRVLEQQRISETLPENCYRIRLTRVRGSELEWETPFGHSYGKQIEKNGELFAKDVKHFMEHVQKRCKLRECDGKYENVLKSYAELLRQAETYTSEVKWLEELLEAESYLSISGTESVRRLYLECCSRCSELCNRDRSEVR